MRRFLIAVLGVAFATSASAATLTLPSITVTGPISTSITCPLLASYTAPLAAGAQICAITVAPAGWVGALALSGTNSGSFTITSLSGTTANLVVGATALAAGSYGPLTITSTP